MSPEISPGTKQTIMITLNNLEPGQAALVTGINGPEKVRNRLMDLGIIAGARVEMLCCAPLGDPILVRVIGTVLALRRNEADTVEIHEISGGECAGRKRHRHRAGRKSE